MTATQLYEAGRLDDAIRAQGSVVRDNPTDARARTFLFELLCFAGEFDRAEKQLEVIAATSKEADLGAWVYRSALHAERARQQMFAEDPPVAPETDDGLPAITGSLNGKRFESLVDADPRLGARLEVFAAGQYTWIPFSHIASIRMEPPKRLRDLLWAPAFLNLVTGAEREDLGEVLLPVLSPLSWRSDDGDIRLGRAAELTEAPDGTTVPIGLKLWLVDEDLVPILDVRTLEIDPAAAEQ